MHRLAIVPCLSYTCQTLIPEKQGISQAGGGLLKKGRHCPFVNRRASVVWQGNLHDGTGMLSTESGVLRDTQYSFRTRFEKGIGTSPDELIAASLGGCFSMTLSDELDRWGLHPERIETTVIVTLEELNGGWAFTRIDLEVCAKVPNAAQNDFIDAALAAKINCPMARLLKTNISMTAHLDI